MCCATGGSAAELGALLQPHSCAAARSLTPPPFLDEDPFLYIDPRGNWHSESTPAGKGARGGAVHVVFSSFTLPLLPPPQLVLYHVYRTGPVGGDAHNCLPGHDGSVVSGLFFSIDGYTWATVSSSPYGNVVDLTDGTQQLLTTRERPKLLFNAAGEPTHLSNGVCPSPGGFNTPFSCPQVSTGCVDCKYLNWDFTNISPLKIA